MKKFSDFISNNPVVSVGIFVIVGPFVFQFDFELPEWFLVICFFLGLTLMHIGTSRYGEWKNKDELEEALKRSKENKDNT